MKLRTRFKKLTLWHKLGVIGALCSIIAVPLALRCRRDSSSHVLVENSPGAIVQTQVDSPNSVQITAEHLHVTKTKETTKPKVTMERIYVNQPDGEKYNTLVRLTIKSPYPVSEFYIKAYAKTIEKIELSKPHGILHRIRFKKSEGFMVVGARQVTGTLELRLVSAKPEKYDLRYNFGTN